MAEHPKDPFEDLDVSGEDFPVPTSRPGAQAAPREHVDHFPETDEPETLPPRRAPLSRRAAPVARDEDFGFDAHAEGADFEDHPAPPEEREPAPPRKGKQVAARAAREVDEEEDDFAGEHADHEGHEAHEGEEDQEGHPREGSTLFGMERRKAIQYAAIAVVMAVVGGIGYTSLSSFFSTPTERTVGALSPVGRQQVAANQFGARPASLPSLPSPPRLPAQGGMRAPEPARPAPPSPAAMDAPSAAETAADKAEIKRLNETVARLEGDIASRPTRKDVQAGIDALQTRLEAVESRAVAPTTPRPGSEPPAKPAVIAGWTLKGVAAGANKVAWLEGPTGFVEAHEGQELQGAGRIKAISKYQDEWIVMTTDGVIVRR